MVAARLKRKQRQAGNVLVAWLKKHNIDPAEPCQGKTALEVLVAKLAETFGQVIAGVSPQGDLLENGSGNVLVHHDDARPFLWGKEVTVVETITEPFPEVQPEPVAKVEEPAKEDPAEAPGDDEPELPKPVKRTSTKKKKSSSSKDKKK